MCVSRNVFMIKRAVRGRANFYINIAIVNMLPPTGTREQNENFRRYGPFYLWRTYRNDMRTIFLERNASAFTFNAKKSRQFPAEQCANITCFS